MKNLLLITLGFFAAVVFLRTPEPLPQSQNSSKNQPAALLQKPEGKPIDSQNAVPSNKISNTPPKARANSVVPKKPAKTDSLPQPTQALNPVPALQPKEWLFVTARKVNLRKGPGIDYDIIDQLAEGDKLAVFDTESGWSKISVEQDAGKLEGWISSRYLAPTPPQKETRQPVKKPKNAVRRQTAPSDRDLTTARKDIIQQSIQAYSGSCPCPYNRDRAGRRCGARSAWSRGGGDSPICYDSDISKARLSTYLARRRGAGQ